MNYDVQLLIKNVCEGDWKAAKAYAAVILRQDKTEKNRRFKESMLEKLEQADRKLIELPQNIKPFLIPSSPDDFDDKRFLLRENENAMADKVLATYRASKRLEEIGISYLPTLLLYGESGCGKTELAKYIAYKAQLPFLYVRFSTLMDSYLGGTQKRIAEIFDFVRTTPCVLCFDEIDTIGMARGQKHDVGEMNRIVITLMQEMDRLPNNVIVIGTTNRFDKLDDALIRRFINKYEVKRLDNGEVKQLAYKFFEFCGIAPPDINEWIGRKVFMQHDLVAAHAARKKGTYFNADEHIATHEVIAACTEYIVSRILEEDNGETLQERETPATENDGQLRFAGA